MTRVYDVASWRLMQIRGEIVGGDPSAATHAPYLFAARCRSSYCFSASSMRSHAAQSSSSAAHLLALFTSGDIIVRNCHRSPTGDFRPRFSAFFFPTILASAPRGNTGNRPMRCKLQQAQSAGGPKRIPRIPCSKNSSGPYLLESTLISAGSPHGLPSRNHRFCEVAAQASSVSEWRIVFCPYLDYVHI